MPETIGIGFNPIVWYESLFKRIIEATAGRGGIEAICQYLDQIDFIPELSDLRRDIKLNSIFLESALSKCNKELLKRPISIRDEEIFGLMGCKCKKCGNLESLWVASEHDYKCACREGSLEPLYILTLEELIEQRIMSTPETILMYEAYERLAQAYSNVFRALRLVMDKTAEMYGWRSFRIEQPELRNYMDEYFLGRLAGEQKIPREEKQLLQFIVRGNLADIPVDEAEKLIRLSVKVIKYGYLYEVLGASGAHDFYSKALTEYNSLYDQLNLQIRTKLAGEYAETRRRRFRVAKTLGGYYAPCLLMPHGSWDSGQISKDIILEPIYRLPIFPKADEGPLQTIYAPKGGGKTFLLSGISCYSILAKHELVFSPLNDKSNSFTLASMPLFAYNKRTEKLTHVLQDILGVEPQGVPTLTLTVLQKDEKMADDNNQHPPTIYDRILRVPDPRGFIVDFDVVMDELKEIAEKYGYSKSSGIVNVRNMDRFNPATTMNVDVQIATNMLVQFDRWRKSHLSQAARVVIDEISYLAASQVTSGDSFRSGSVMSDFVKESRRSRLSLEVATQRPLEVLTDIRDAATNVFFRDLSMSRDKNRSQIDFLLDSLQLRDPSIRSVVRDLNNRGTLGKGYWFWYHQPLHTIDVIKPCPPSFCLQDIGLTPREIIKLYEKKSGEKILLESWKQVKAFQMAETGTCLEI
jgi:hypothetical protein